MIVFSKKNKQWVRKLNVRIAFPEEIEFYFKVLYPVQDKILRVVSEEFGNAFYLTGGTALSRFYFEHRLSEDLDLFTANEKISLVVPILAKLIEDLGHKVEVETSSMVFGRLFVKLKRDSYLKIDLVRELPVGGIKEEKGFCIDSLLNIGANKITAFEDRAELKDVIDLYFLLTEGGLSFDQLFELADRKRKPVPYENLLAINTFGLSGSVLMLKEISNENLMSFLETLKQQVEKNVEKKVQELKGKEERIIQTLLWDFPSEERKLDKESAIILKRRLRGLSYPKRILLEEFVSYLNPCDRVFL